jgi:hypothetical protein
MMVAWLTPHCGLYAELQCMMRKVWQRCMNIARIALVIIALLALLVSCGGGGGVSGGGTGGSSLTSSMSSGVISGLGSIYVGGFEFTDELSSVTSQDGQVVKPQDLGLGVHVSVRAKSDRLQSSTENQAERIQIQRWFMGMLEVQRTSASSAGVLRVNGQRVLTDRRTIVVGAASATAFEGRKVHVSGYLEPTNNDIVATRIELTSETLAKNSLVFLTARVQSIDAVVGMASLGFATVSFSLSTNEALSVGNVIRIEAEPSSAMARRFSALKIEKIVPTSGTSDLALRGVVQSRPSAASPNSPLMVDGYTIDLTSADFATLSQVRKGSVIEVKGRLEELTIKNASVRIVANPIETVLGEEPLVNAVEPSDFDYFIDQAIVQSVNVPDNSFVIRDTRIRIVGGRLPPEIYAGARVSLAGVVKQDANGFYLDAAVTQTDRSWTAVSDLGDERVLGLSVDATGGALAVWGYNTDQVQSTRYDFAQAAWIAQAAVSTGVGSASFDVASNRVGDIALVFSPNSPACLSAKIYRPATGWGATQQIGSVCRNSSDPVAVRMSDNGSAIAVWREITGGPSVSYSIWASVFDVGTGLWSEASSISPGVATPVNVTDVAMNSVGQAIVVWNDGANTYSNWYAAPGWQSTISVSNSAGVFTGVALDNQGRATAVYAVSNSLFAKQFTSGAGWSATPVLLDTLSGGGKGSMDVDTNGNVVAVWRRSTSSGGLFASRFGAASGQWSPSTQIVSSPARVDNMKIALTSQGQGVLSFNSVNSASPAVYNEAYALRYNSVSNQWASVPTLMQATPSNLSTGLPINNQPLVAVNENGLAAVTWSQRDVASVARNYGRVLR